MTRYSNDKILFSAVVKAFSPIIYYYIDHAILQGNAIYYAEERSPYKIIDAAFDEIKQSLTFYFAENITKTIDLNIYEIKQSNSEPHKFYFSNKDKTEDSFTINFHHS